MQRHAVRQVAKGGGPLIREGAKAITICRNHSRGARANRVAHTSSGVPAIRVCRAILFGLPTDRVCPIDLHIMAAAHLVGKSRVEIDGTHVRRRSQPVAKVMSLEWMAEQTASHWLHWRAGC